MNQNPITPDPTQGMQGMQPATPMFNPQFQPQQMPQMQQPQLTPEELMMLLQASQAAQPATPQLQQPVDMSALGQFGQPMSAPVVDMSQILQQAPQMPQNQLQQSEQPQQSPEQPIDLSQLAKQYKNPEEFIKNIKNPLYHGTNEQFDKFDLERAGEQQVSDWGAGAYFADKPDIAKGFAKVSGGDIVMERYAPDAKFADIKTLKEDSDFWTALDNEMNDEAIIDYLNKQGYDGIKVPHKEKGGWNEYVIFNPDKLLSREDLNDIWNKANEKYYFGTKDKYVYHADATNAPVELFAENGIKPSKRGQSGPGVYMANKPENTEYNYSSRLGDKAQLYRIDKNALIKKFGTYPENKNGIEFDNTSGEILLSGNRPIPPEFIEVQKDGKWRKLTEPTQQSPEQPEQTQINPFDNKTEISQINRILKNEDTVSDGLKIADYYKKAKGEDWQVVKMSPMEYLQRASKVLGSTETDMTKYKSGDVEKYAADMKKGDKFPMPYINEVKGTQEGRTRALAALKLGVAEIPVAVAKPVKQK